MREAAQEAQARSVAQTRRVAGELARHGLVTRDIGRILGVSAQRISQYGAKRAAGSALSPLVMSGSGKRTSKAGTLTHSAGGATLVTKKQGKKKRKA